METKPNNPVRKWFNGVVDSVAKGYADSKLKELADYKVSLKDVLFVTSLAVSITALVVTHSKVPSGIPNIVIIR